MKKLLFVNGRVVNEGRISELDVLVSHGRIDRLGTGPVPAGTDIVDLDGLHVLPGVIDDQVHFREPGMTHKATIESESLAAICGGVTSYLDMPNNSPPAVDRAALAAKKALASRSSYANFGFYLGATNGNVEELGRAAPSDACGIKVFMGASTGNMLVDDAATLDAIFSVAQLLVVTHCEDSPMIRAAEQLARERYGEDVPMSEHPRIRSAEACLKSSSLAVDLARRHGTRLHVLHLTTARELALFDAGPIAEKRITVEACVHHLWFDETRYGDLGTRIKCNPAIKTAEDRRALIAAVNDDVIDIIATDHAPHTLEEKSRSYFSAPAGLPLVQHMLPMLLDQHRDGIFSLETIVEKTAHNPARLFRIEERGFIREGYVADLAIVDLHATTRVTSEAIRYKCGWSPLESCTLRAAVVMTVLGGEIVVDRGSVTGPPRGRALTFAR
ncbi:dihydroorotase [Candidatus Rariloculus sp.]|uniref:dihydroorotase n=1 Tax=Candidatus Rariloculus sp. TaxID=3101265 RepID=UPI003D0FECCC